MGSQNRAFLSIFVIAFCLMPRAVEPSPHPRLGGQLQHAIFQRITTLDGINYLNYAELQVASQLYEGLVRRDRFGGIVAGIAQSWRHSADYRIWTFTLPQNATFHDGEAVRATDVKRAWERFVNENWMGGTDGKSFSPLFSIDGAANYRNDTVEAIAGIQVLDDYHLRVVLKEGDVEFLSKLTGPTAWVTKSGNVAGGSLHPIGTGRFYLESYRPEEIKLSANTGYVWGRPYLAEVTFRYYGDVRKALFDFESGVLDALHLPLTEAARRRREDLDEILIQTDSAVGIYLRRMPGVSERPVWYDVLKYALDIDALLRLQYGASSVQVALTPSPLYYNPTKARRRLKDSPAIRLVYAPLPDNTGNAIATRLQRSYLSQIGLQVFIENTGAGTFQDALRDSVADLALLATPLLQSDDTTAHQINQSNALIPLYLLASNFLCQSHLRNINIGWGGIPAFDQVWLVK